MTDHTRDTLYIDGTWAVPAGTATLTLTNPYTERPIGTVPAGTAEDVDRAARAAARALPGWSALPWTERVAYCARIADGLKARVAEIAAVATAEMGAPYVFSVLVQAGFGVADFASVADVAPRVEWRREQGNSVLTRRAAGVVGAITPWNYPLHQVTAKTAAALAAGCTVVLKPAELTPGVAYVLAEVMADAGLPPGVFNLVTGTGPDVGEAIVTHPLMDMVSFTGSTRAGRRVAELAAAAPKRTALELGGKSASVLLDDLAGDAFAGAVAATLTGCLNNSGQTCSATTRLVLPRARVDEAAEILAGLAAATVLGDPADPATQQGPLVSAAQRDRVRGHITAALADGARLVAGGPEQPAGLPTGYFVKPTVLVAEAGSRIEQEEVFGPVLTVVPYDGGDDAALAVAEGTPYGLAGAVWAADADRAAAFAGRMRAGQISVNGGVVNPTAPFGGYGQSGYGREMGADGIEEFTAVTAVQF
ncbi:aldehyde dehydrogenase family protein [Actinomadura atramentaria]|uniref:aldehyde dehydrogenase family protein n=1 Tax=Actinomadura atramentaria TaxID=1990 RepID=UPI00037ACA5D|nr:aldehyde dehydrogenase family protein [Actinomadura atramentaria]